MKKSVQKTLVISAAAAMSLNLAIPAITVNASTVDELYKAACLKEELELEMIAIPWLDANKKFEYTLKRSGETMQFVTKSISVSFAQGTMSVNAVKFYQDDPDGIKVKGLV